MLPSRHRRVRVVGWRLGAPRIEENAALVRPTGCSEDRHADAVPPVPVTVIGNGGDKVGEVDFSAGVVAPSLWYPSRRIRVGHPQPSVAGPAEDRISLVEQVGQVRRWAFGRMFGDVAADKTTDREIGDAAPQLGGIEDRGLDCLAFPLSALAVGNAGRNQRLMRATVSSGCPQFEQGALPLNERIAEGLRTTRPPRCTAGVISACWPDQRRRRWAADKYRRGPMPPGNRGRCRPYRPTLGRGSGRRCTQR